MKKRLLALGLALGLSVAGNMISFAGEWKQDTTGWWYQNDDGSYTVNDWQKIDDRWFLFDSNGYMVEKGNWDGGFIAFDGALLEDPIWGYTDGVLSYARITADEPELFASVFGMENLPPNGVHVGETGVYESRIDWRNQLLKAWYNTMGDFENYGTYTFDFQVPANWKSQVPAPILSTCIDYMCMVKWGGLGYTNWNFTWEINPDTYMLHLTANYFPVETTQAVDNSDYEIPAGWEEFFVTAEEAAAEHEKGKPQGTGGSANLTDEDWASVH